MGEKLKPVLDALTPVLAQVGKQIGDAFVKALNQLLPFLPQLVQCIVDLALAMIPLLPQFADLAASLLPMLADILVQTMPYLIKIIEEFTKFAVAVMPKVIAIVKKVVEILQTVMNKISDLASWAGRKFGEIVDFVKGLRTRSPPMPGHVGQHRVRLQDGDERDRQVVELHDGQAVVHRATVGDRATAGQVVRHAEDPRVRHRRLHRPGWEVSARRVGARE